MKNTLILWAYSAALLGASPAFALSSAPASPSAFDQSAPTPATIQTRVDLKFSDISAGEGAELEAWPSRGQFNQANSRKTKMGNSPSSKSRKYRNGQGTRAAGK